MKTFIKNRNNKKIAVVVEENPNGKGLVFIMHGLGGHKEQSHMQTFTEAFRVNDFSVVLFDATNSYGESDGEYADATTTNYYEDLEDVISWAMKQSWYQEPFWLAGHSLGGICMALYAQKHPGKVKALAPISTVVSGKLSMTSRTKAKELAEWKRTGWLVRASTTRPGLMKKLKWTEMEDRLKYDLLLEAHKLRMPILMIVGEKDESTPPEHQKILFDKLPGKKELHVIKNAPHTFKDTEHLVEVKHIMGKWIRGNI